MTTGTSGRGSERLLFTALASRSYDLPKGGAVARAARPRQRRRLESRQSHAYGREYCVVPVQLSTFLRATSPRLRNRRAWRMSTTDDAAFATFKSSEQYTDT